MTRDMPEGTDVNTTTCMHHSETDTTTTDTIVFSHSRECQSKISILHCYEFPILVLKQYTNAHNKRKRSTLRDIDIV